MQSFVHKFQGIYEINELTKIKSIAYTIGKPCIWAIIALLNSTKDKTLNITSIISNLNSNYSTIIRCIEYMRTLDMVHEVRLGRIRLIQLNCSNEIVKAMINILNNV
uniref:ArsR family transcriptional regulator n=1 Tax=Ignisphaera aggregans TaxID=334771 RepID=A0A7J3QEZ1_9CREN